MSTDGWQRQLEEPDAAGLALGDSMLGISVDLACRAVPVIADGQGLSDDESLAEVKRTFWRLE